jgi:hypothetical protein
MADEDLLRIIEQGVEVWNQWRQKNLLIRRDLNNTKLRSRNLKKTDFWNLPLRGADLILLYIFIFNRIGKKALRKQHELREGFNHEET